MSMLQKVPKTKKSHFLKPEIIFFKDFFFLAVVMEWDNLNIGRTKKY